MILVNEINRFEMILTGYQFPGRNFDEYDDNWLLVSISVDHPKGVWTSTDACLLTWEAARLSEWLRAVANSTNTDKEEDFIEPNLHFELVDDKPPKLRVYFELECRPSWAPADGAGMDDLWVEFDVNSPDLQAAADAIERDLKKFPRRPSNKPSGHS